MVGKVQWLNMQPMACTNNKFPHHGKRHIQTEMQSTVASLTHYNQYSFKFTKFYFTIFVPQWILHFAHTHCDFALFFEEPWNTTVWFLTFMGVTATFLYARQVPSSSRS